MAEQLALQEPRGDGRTVELDEGPLAARAQVVKGTGDKLLARARFAANEHRGAGGGDGLDLLQDLAQGGAPPDDILEVVLGADLFLQVSLRLGELVLQRLDLLKGHGVIGPFDHSRELAAANFPGRGPRGSCRKRTGRLWALPNRRFRGRNVRRLNPFTEQRTF